MVAIEFSSDLMETSLIFFFQPFNVEIKLFYNTFFKKEKKN